MKKIFLTILIVLLFASPVYCADYYIAQSAAGSGDGSSCANADAIADLTWGTGNMVKAGDTLHLCGTITSTLTIGASGTDSTTNAITIKFEDGARFSMPTWTTGTGAINSSAKNYIIIDGGTNGIIEATDNGTSATFGGTKTYSADIYGVYITNCTGCEVKNLTIQNIYDRLASSTDCNKYGKGIYATGSFSNISINNCTISDNAYAINLIATGNTDIVNVYNNTIADTGLGINVAPYGGTIALSSVNIYSNTISGGNTWDGSWATSGCGCTTCGDGHVHQDGMHIYKVLTGDSISNLRVYSNLLQDFGTHSTGHIYIEAVTGTLSYPFVYNNVMVNTGTNYAANGMLVFKGAINGAGIYNNTFIGNYPTYNGNTAIYFNSSSAGYSTDISVRNNILSSIKYFINANGTFGTSTTFTVSDHNVLYNGDSSTPFYDGSMRTLSWWQANIGDGTGSGSVTDNPNLDASYVPQIGSCAIDNGTDLSAYFVTDKNGDERTGTWDIGAIETGASADTTAPTITAAVINEAGTQITLTASEAINVNDATGFVATMSGGAVTITYTSKTSNTITYNLSRVVAIEETGSLAYTTVSNGIEDTSENDLASFSGGTALTITNGSTYTPSITAYTVTPSTLMGAACLISPAVPTSVGTGLTTQFTCTAQNNYECVAWTGTCGGTGTTTLTTSAITGDCTVIQPCKKIASDTTIGTGCAITVGSGPAIKVY